MTLEFVALHQLHRRLDALPLEQLVADALADDVLEVLDAGGFDALALGFLLLALQHELHPLRFLLRLLLGLDGVLQRFGQLQVAQQDVLDDDAARRDLAPHVLQDLLRDPLAPVRVERRGGVAGGDGANRRAEVRHQQHLRERRADLTGRPSPPARDRGDRGSEASSPMIRPSFDGTAAFSLISWVLMLNSVTFASGVDDVDAFGERPAGHAAEDADHADVTRFARTMSPTRRG